MENRATFPSATASPGDARRWAGQWCLANRCDGQTDVLALVISELVTNATQHSTGEIEVGLERRGDRIHGFVRDETPGTFSPRPPSDEIGGWGLIVVSELTESWIVDSDAHGKSVSFEVTVAARGRETDQVAVHRTPATDDPRQFHDLVSSLDHPVAIVTTAAGDVRAGCLVGFHAQSGIDPPEYAVWLSKANHTYRVGALSDTFAIHFPTSSQMHLAELFGSTTGNEVDKFARCSWVPGPNGVPLLEECHNRFVGRRAALLDGGTDHVCLMLRPQQTQRSTSREDPLLLSAVLHLAPGHEAEERQRPRR